MALARKRYKVDRNDNNRNLRTTHTLTCHIQDEQACDSVVQEINNTDDDVSFQPQVYGVQRLSYEARDKIDLWEYCKPLRYFTSEQEIIF